MLRLPFSLVDSYRKSSPAIDYIYMQSEPNRCFSPKLEEAVFAARRSQLITQLFPGVPDAERIFGDKIPKYIPPNVDMWKMFQEASALSPQEWIERVHNKGVWDFKQLDCRYRDFGNWAYAFSATGNSHGDVSRLLYLIGAGWAQFEAGTYELEWCFSGSFCDDPDDQRMINMGFDIIQDAVRLRTPDTDTNWQRDTDDGSSSESD